MKRFQITVAGRAFDVEVLSDPQQDRVEVTVDGQPFTVEVRAGVEETTGTMLVAVNAPAPVVALVAPPAGATMSGSAVRAPLPGMVKSIAVQPGTQVARGDELLVIEAMKMNNLIRSPRNGVIDAVHVVEGRRVGHGETLLEYRD